MLTTFIDSSGRGAIFAEIPLHRDMASTKTIAFSNACIVASIIGENQHTLKIAKHDAENNSTQGLSVKSKMVSGALSVFSPKRFKCIEN